MGTERLHPEHGKCATSYQRYSDEFESRSAGRFATKHCSARPTGGAGNGTVRRMLGENQRAPVIALRQAVASGNPLLLSVSHIVDQKLDNLVFGRPADLR